MVDPRYVTISVKYDRELRYGRSLAWIAPELKDSALAMTEDKLGEPAPTRTWAGFVDGPTYEQFAQDWRLAKDTYEATFHSAGDRDLVTHTYTLDGMNWESDGESPIICVSVAVTEQAAPHA